MRILVADDDDDTRYIVASVVESLNCKPLQASDGNKALELFNAQNPDLAILDVMMPGLNGNQLCQEIKKSEHGQLTPVIMLTAKDTIQDIVDSLEGGADDYLTKPFNYQELQARIKALIRVRELNLNLQKKNEELQAMQAKLVETERQEAVGQLAGTAAHKLGQPLSAILLNCHLLEKLPKDDAKFIKSLKAIESDAHRMKDMIEKLKSADAKKKQKYHGKSEILDLDE